MGANKLAKKTPKCPKMYLPKLSAKAQKHGFFLSKKASLGVCSPCMIPWEIMTKWGPGALHLQINCTH